MKPGMCSSCSARIFWVLMASGSRMPLDVEPVLDGNVVLTAGGARVLKKGEATEELRFLSHFSTCPNAGVHRRTRS